MIGHLVEVVRGLLDSLWTVMLFIILGWLVVMSFVAEAYQRKSRRSAPTDLYDWKTQGL